VCTGISLPIRYGAIPGQQHSTCVRCHDCVRRQHRNWSYLPPTLGDRAFPVASARPWNTLAHSVSSASSLPTFRRLLKTHLFQRSFSSSFYLFLTFVQCPWSGFHCDSVTLILSSDDDDDDDDIAGNEFETVDIAPFSAPPELPETMKSAESSTHSTAADSSKHE